MEFKYVIGDKTYVQKELYLGQYKQLLGIMSGMTFPSEVDAMSFILALKDNISTAMAIVLTEEGTSVRDKNIEELSKDLDFAMYPEDVMKVANDFFDCNQISSLLRNLGQSVEKITTKMQEIQTPTP